MRVLALTGVVLSSLAAAPPASPPSPLVQDLLSARWLSPSQRSALHRFHGLWGSGDIEQPEHRAEVAHWAWLLADASLAHGDPLWAAEDDFRRGDITSAINRLAPLPEGPRRDALLAACLFDAARPAEARDAATRAASVTTSDPLEHRAVLQAQRLLTEHTETELNIAAKARGALHQLETARMELDPACWPLLLDEAQLLAERDSRPEAAAAIKQALALNPRSAEALWHLGKMHLSAWNFASATGTAERLREIDQNHVLANLLDARAALLQQRWADADGILAALPANVGAMHDVAGLRIASAALQGDTATADAIGMAALRAHPGAAEPMAIAGGLLGAHRRFDQAEHWLQQGLQVQSSDHNLWTDLGLMRWQAGQDEHARAALLKAVALNPFDRRAANSLRALSDMADWSSQERDNIVVRWAPGVDDVFAAHIADEAAAIHRHVERALQWTPARPTVLEIHPDQQSFAVRVTGMPEVHTMAACTGPVVAMAAPRAGAPGRHAGPYDWRGTLQHELSHVAHLDLSRYAVPLWFTEGAAVASEPLPLRWTDRVRLAEHWRNGTLLQFDELNWSFVRPRRPGDRALAYNQCGWLVMKLMEQFGHEVVGDLLRAVGAGRTMDEAFIERTGHTPDHWWALHLDSTMPDDLAAWGLLDQAPPGAATLDLAEQLQLLETHSHNAALLELVVRTMQRDAPDHAALPGLLEQLAAAQPMAPAPRVALAQLLEQDERFADAADALAACTFASAASPAQFDRLALLQRRAGRIESALTAMEQAVWLDPYSVGQRARAAALAVEARRLDLARRHINAMIVLEPEDPVHRRRLDALDALP